MEENIKYQFNYKGYVIVVSDRDGHGWIYITHDTIDIEEGEPTPNCKSVEVCIQWIDEDARCRKEEADKEERAGLTPEVVAAYLLDDKQYENDIQDMLMEYFILRPKAFRGCQDIMMGTDTD